MGNVNIWLVAGAAGLAGVWWFLRGKAPFAVGDIVAMPTHPEYGLGPVTRVNNAGPPNGWLIDVQFNVEGLVQAIPAGLLVKV